MEFLIEERNNKDIDMIMIDDSKRLRTIRCWSYGVFGKIISFINMYGFLLLDIFYINFK